MTRRDDTYSVRLPSAFPYVGSKIARQMLTTLFAQRVPLANDPGSGEKYLKLTLPRAQVRALQALADGDAPGVALRRLVATFTRGLPAREIRPIRQLPMARTYPVLEAEIITEPEVRRSRPLPQPRVPEAEALRSSLKNRPDWTPEYRAMIAARIRELEGVASPKLPRANSASSHAVAHSSRPLINDFFWRFLLLLTAV